MANIFGGAIQQYIDDHGKCRLLVYKEEITIMISPIPPLALPTISLEDIKLTTFEGVKSFAKKRRMEIKELYGDEEEIKGVWLELIEANPGIYSIFIPIKPSPIVKDYPITAQGDPLQTFTSELEVYRKNKRIAEILKGYTLYTYSLHPDRFPLEDEESWENNFEINPKHKYINISKRYDSKSKSIYSNDKIIVTSKNIMRNLISYLGAMIENDPKGLEEMKERTTIDGFYQSASDFRSHSDQIIFSSRDGLMKWRNSKILGEDKFRNRVSEENQDTLEPYYYRHPQIKKESLMIVQNVVDGKLERAVSASYMWLKDGKNPLSNCEVVENINDVSYTVFSVEDDYKKTYDQRKTKEPVSIIKYKNGKYGALLLFP